MKTTENYRPVGKDLPPLKTPPGQRAAGVPPASVPITQSQFLSPRYEPSNITTNATVIQIQTAIREAENGNTQDLFRFYRDVLLSDNHIQSEITTRKLAMLAQPLAILPADKENADDTALAAALLQAKNDCENWNDGMIALLDSHCGWPVAIVERLYQPAKDPKLMAKGVPRLNFTLRKFVPVNYQLLCYQWAYLQGGVGAGVASAIQLANMGNTQTGQASYTIDLEVWEPYIKLWPTDAQGRIIFDVTNATYLDQSRHIVHRGHLLSGLRDNWGGPMRAILMWWLFRNLGRGWFARGMERYQAPFPVAYTDINDPAQVALLREAFSLANTIGGLVVSENSRIELQQAMVQGMAEGYETFHRICNDEISKLITGKDSTSKPAGLNAGEANTGENVREDYRMFDQQRLGETLKKQIADPFRDINGLVGEVKFVWGGLSDDDANTFADLLVSMKNAGYELTDESLPTANERTGLSWQKVEVPDPLGGGMNGEGGGANGRPKTFSAGSLIRTLDSRPSTLDPMAPIIEARIKTLSAAYRGAMAPFRNALFESTSKEDCLKRLKAIFPDWTATRLNEEMETALQLCSAAGAASAVHSPQSTV